MPFPNDPTKGKKENTIHSQSPSLSGTVREALTQISRGSETEVADIETVRFLLILWRLKAAEWFVGSRREVKPKWCLIVEDRTQAAVTVGWILAVDIFFLMFLCFALLRGCLSKN